MLFSFHAFRLAAGLEGLGLGCVCLEGVFLFRSWISHQLPTLRLWISHRLVYGSYLSSTYLLVGSIYLSLTFLLYGLYLSITHLLTCLWVASITFRSRIILYLGRLFFF